MLLPDHCLRIALVTPAGGEEPYGELAHGLARRGHRVRRYTPETGYEPLFRRLRADGADVVSVHAFDARAIELAHSLPVLHTLHVPATLPAMVRACRQSNAPLVAVSEFAAKEWREVLGRDVQVIRNGVPDVTPLGAVVQPVALIAGRIPSERDLASAMRAAAAAGLRVHIVGDACGQRRDLWQLMAASAVYLATGDRDMLASQAQVTGCPVVGYACGALPEIVEQGVSGVLAPPGDQAALVAAIRRAMAMDRRAVRSSGRARLLINRMLDRYESELRALAERSLPPRAQVIPHPALTNAS